MQCSINKCSLSLSLLLLAVYQANQPSMRSAPFERTSCYNFRDLITQSIQKPIQLLLFQAIMISPPFNFLFLLSHSQRKKSLKSLIFYFFFFFESIKFHRRNNPHTEINILNTANLPGDVIFNILHIKFNDFIKMFKMFKIWVKMMVMAMKITDCEGIDWDWQI